MIRAPRNRPSRPFRTARPTADVLVVHSSDVHVDDGYTARVHNGDGTNGLRAVLETARSLRADVVLLAGDTFEHNRLPATLLDRTARLLESAGMPVVILPGNHDPAIPDSPWRRGGLGRLPNVSVLGVTHDVAVVFAEHELEVWGRAHLDYDDMKPLATKRRRSTRWQIALAHGHYEPKPDLRTNLRPSWLISDAEIAATRADYVALGHWNSPKRVGNGTVPAYYSGAPEYARTVNAIRLGADGSVVVRRRPIRWD